VGVFEGAGGPRILSLMRSLLGATTPHCARRRLRQDREKGAAGWLACGGSIARTSSARSGRTNMAANWQLGEMPREEKRRSRREQIPEPESSNLRSLTPSGNSLLTHYRIGAIDRPRAFQSDRTCSSLTGFFSFFFIADIFCYLSCALGLVVL
jgi:hypothetical protein